MKTLVIQESISVHHREDLLRLEDLHEDVREDLREDLREGLREDLRFRGGGCNSSAVACTFLLPNTPHTQHTILPFISSLCSICSSSLYYFRFPVRCVLDTVFASLLLSSAERAAPLRQARTRSTLVVSCYAFLKVTLTHKQTTKQHCNASLRFVTLVRCNQLCMFSLSNSRSTLVVSCYAFLKPTHAVL